MRILLFDEKRGVARMVPSHPEDLWDLYNLIEEGDLVGARTQRVVKVGSEDNPLKTKMWVSLIVSVRKTTLDIFSETLSVTGIVESCPEDLEGAKGHYHTITIKVGIRITITKSRWTNLDKKRLKMAQRSRGHTIAVVALDYDVATIAMVSEGGILATKEMRQTLTGKAEPSVRQKDIDDFFQEIIETLRSFSKTEHEKIIVLGPGFAKDHFIDFLKDRSADLYSRIICKVGATSGTLSAVNEALNNDDVKKKIGSLRVIEETEQVERFFELLARNSKLVCYGIDQVKIAVSLGAVERLLMHEHLPLILGKSRKNDLEDLIKETEASRSDFVFISSRHEAGRKLRSIGGLAALLRFPVE